MMMQEQSITLEHERILADLHDGLGASLIGLLRHVQSGKADCASIERRVHEALREMRIAIDALWPHEDRLDTVLGNLRYRLDDPIRDSGMQLQWAVEPLPPVAGLLPSHVFSIQRIVLEAMTNALKHSGARRLTITARAPDRAQIEISVSDDGFGFDLARVATGVGLASMRARAQRIGARLDIHACPGKGTAVRLTLPCAPLPSIAASRQASVLPQPAGCSTWRPPINAGAGFPATVAEAPVRQPWSPQQRRSGR